MALRLRKNVQVHDSEKYPAGGPLTTIEAGVYARDIPEHMLSQLHVDHFKDDGDADDFVDAPLGRHQYRAYDYERDEEVEAPVVDQGDDV
jgi:hypothetical protein